MVSSNEKTKQQTGDVVSMLTDFPGFVPGPLGHYRIYRMMRANPTIALARAVATAPVRTATWHVVTEKGFENKEMVEFIHKEMALHWKSFLRNLLFSLDYGWAPFEKVWGLREGRLVYRKLKPLLVDITKILVNKDTGVFEGFRNKADMLSTEYSFLYTYDGESGNLYGRSRHENIRNTAWTTWTQLMARFGKYVNKVSGIIPIIEYPEGVSKDATGKEVDNFAMATKVLQNLGSGNGVAMPNTLIRWADEAVRQGIDITKMKSWMISFLESKGNHGKGFTDGLRYADSLMMRGWLVPERTALEGQHGTKAESSTQGNVGLTLSDLLFEEILEQMNWHLVNPLLVKNYGVGAENKVKLARSGPNRETRELMVNIVEKVLSSDNNTDLFMKWLNVEDLLDTLSLPKNPNFDGNPERDVNDDTKRENEKLNKEMRAFLGS